MTPEEFCRQTPPRAIPPRLTRPDPWLLGGALALTIAVLWVTVQILEGVTVRVYVLVTYALLVFLCSLIGRRGRLRFRNLLQHGIAVQGVVRERGTKSQKLQKSTFIFYFVEITFPGGELEPIKQTVPEEDWYRLKESSTVSVLHDPTGRNGYLLVDILKLA